MNIINVKDPVFSTRRKDSFARTVYAIAYPYVRLSVCPSDRHTPVLSQNEGTQMDAVFTIR